VSRRRIAVAGAAVLTAIVAAALVLSRRPAPAGAPPRAARLYWFIPDGLRAEPDVFRVFDWAREGKLPNLKRMMDQGTWGYSVPVFPSHTPTNFATLLTGTYPAVHGVSDGPMHTEGAPLEKPSLGGFSAPAKRVAPIWKLLENPSRRTVLLSIPGSTPPELDHGITIRGRWGGWGADTPAILFEPSDLLPLRSAAGRAFRLFFLGEKLTRFVEKRPAAGWGGELGFGPPLEATLSAHGLDLHALVVDSTDDGRAGYDQVAFALDRSRPLFRLAPGRWSDWIEVVLKWRDQPVASHMRVKVVKLWPDTGNFRIRVFFDNVNRLLAEPPETAAQLVERAGPMVDFADNWPAQLVYEDEDRETFREEAMDSLAWHKRATAAVFDLYKPDVFLQDTYTPNLMLESRWWMRHVEPGHPGRDPAQEAGAWKDVLEMYRGVDAILGEALAHAGPDTLVAFSSDHGVLGLRRQVRLNNLFARKGWLSSRVDAATGQPAIDWEKTRVVYLKMAYVYVNPDGLAGAWKRGSGPAYEALRDEVVHAIRELRDEDGTAPLVRAVRREDAPRFLDLPDDRVGDLVLEAAAGYQWWEEVTPDLALFSTPLVSGYKQAVDPQANRGMWTPFAIAGPGVRRGFALSEPVSHVDQLPTILTLMGERVPAHVQGRVLREALSARGETAAAGRGAAGR